MFLTVDTENNVGTVRFSELVSRSEFGPNNFCTVTIRALEDGCDVAVDPCESYTTMSLQILDTNDNEPNITAMSNNITIDENPSGILEGFDIFVEDLDSDEDYNTFHLAIDPPEIGQVLLLQPETGFQSTAVNFKVNPDNVTYFDFETRDRIEFALIATDSENNTFVDRMDFTIILRDVNDNFPYFVDEYSHSINESLLGNAPLELLQVEAFDADATSDEFGKNSLEYSLTAVGLPIDVDPKTGMIFFTQTGEGILDYDEGETEHLITVYANDMNGVPGSKVAFTNFTLTVLPVNDEKPALTVLTDLTELCMYEEDEMTWPPGESCTNGSTEVGHLFAAQFEAKDKDENADLSISINWGESEARKDGRPVENNANNGCIFWDTLEVSTIASNGTYAKVEIVTPGPNGHIDRECLDEITLVVEAVDGNDDDLSPDRAIDRGLH